MLTKIGRGKSFIDARTRNLTRKRSSLSASLINPPFFLFHTDIQNTTKNKPKHDMAIKKVAPYGEWESPITIEDATAGSKAVSSPRGDVRHIYIYSPPSSTH